MPPPATTPHRRVRGLGALLTIAATLLAVVVPAGSASAETVSRWVFTAFTNVSESNMYVYTSTDATSFALLKGPAYTPPSGLVRDPSIMRHSDGRYYVAYTVNWTGAEFGIASSADLVTWTFVRNVAIPLSGIYNTWAPEWFIDPADGSVNVIVSLSTGSYGPFRPYRMRALNTALSSWSTPAALGGFTTNHIDTFIVRSGTTYHAFAKNETTKYVEHATASSLEGPYTFVGTGNWSGWGSGLEGVALTRLDNGSWRVFMDGYASSPQRYYYADSANLDSWSAKTEVPGGLSGFTRHGTALRQTVDTATGFTSTAVARHSGKCLDVSNGVSTTGAQLQQYTCNGASAQSFTFSPAVGGWFTVVGGGNGLCLDINGASTADGAAVIQWTCTRTGDQTFALRAQRDGSYQLVAAHSGKCLDIGGVSAANGAKSIQWTCASGANQRWSLPGRP